MATTCREILYRTREHDLLPIDQERREPDGTQVGLHHFCLRARSREDIDETFRFVEQLGATLVHGPQEDGFAPGYYSILFEDPDGIRIEVNYAPGKGHLEPNPTLPRSEPRSSPS